MIVVFSGYNQRSVITFLRTLEDNNLDYQIIAAGEKDTIFLTDYASKVVYTRKKEALDLEDIDVALNKIEKSGVNLIAPSTEALNRFLLKHREYFEKMGFILPLVNEELYEKISDKEKFVELCGQQGIRVPSECSLPEKFERPLVAKPKTYFSSDNSVHTPIFLTSQGNLDHFIKDHNKEDFIYQEFVDKGRHVYLLFYFDKNGNYYVRSQENYIQQPNGKSIMFAKSSNDYNDNELVLPYARLFLMNGFRGLVMVEVIRNEDGDYMIEANPRFWGPSQLFYDMGCNFFEYFLCDYEIINEAPKRIQKDACYFWSSGIPADKILDSESVFYNDGKIVFKENEEMAVKAEIYNHDDTKKINDAEHLKWLYSQTSKHSNYQILPNILEDIIGDGLSIKSRHEKERLKYIEDHIDITEKSLLDIGGNTGFFTIQSVVDGAGHVDYYEGNRNHADFVEGASKILGFQKQIKVYSEYYDFESDNKKYDVIYNLNVLHHMGDDFDAGKDKEFARENIISCINNMAKNTDMMVFQLGFNWKGNRDECLFEKGEKTEMIDYIKNGTKNYWEILNIGIAVRSENGGVKYEEANEGNLGRDDSLGEFLNRPIFIMKSIGEQNG
ncbi:ATP-grasp domain-containing protein [Candidatus Saccharibacteria bacterium]|nr:ATP-grasp domain-containing protein [Candidatus Saccharibacteria bacterium]